MSLVFTNLESFLSFFYSHTIPCILNNSEVNRRSLTSQVLSKKIGLQARIEGACLSLSAQNIQFRAQGFLCLPDLASWSVELSTCTASYDQEMNSETTICWPGVKQVHECTVLTTSIITLILIPPLSSFPLGWAFFGLYIS